MNQTTTLLLVVGVAYFLTRPRVPLATTPAVPVNPTVTPSYPYPGYGGYPYPAYPSSAAPQPPAWQGITSGAIDLIGGIVRAAGGSANSGYSSSDSYGGYSSSGYDPPPEGWVDPFGE